MKRAGARLTTLLAALLLAAPLGKLAHAESWRVALIGDTPYSDYERRELPVMLGEIAATHPDLIIHAGDFKHSRMPCSDALFADRRALFDAQPAPFVFVPGDNEWTDCDRLPAGGYRPEERLQKLRELFFAEPRSLGRKTLPVERQSAAAPEHLRWRLGPVLFVTLNVPGGNNNYGRAEHPGAEFAARNPQVIAWLKAGFAAARRDQLPGIVVVMQANPAFEHFAAGLPHSGYRELLETLRDEAQDFPGQVVLVHGDTHWQRIDRPLRDAATKKPLANFRRVETFGYPIMGWVQMFIDSDAPELFRFAVHAYKAAEK